MKNFRLLSMTALVVLSMLTACSSDDDGPAQDCFDCANSGITTRYCYNPATNSYTISFAGQVVQEVELEEGETWAEEKASIQEDCD